MKNGSNLGLKLEVYGAGSWKGRMEVSCRRVPEEGLKLTAILVADVDGMGVCREAHTHTSPSGGKAERVLGGVGMWQAWLLSPGNRGSSWKSHMGGR